MDIDYIKKFLEENFNLSDIEISIYLALLRKGKLTILEISRATDIHRSTVHLNVENLRQAGLVTQTTSGRGRKRYIIAEPPERFEQILENRKREIEHTEDNLKKVITGLSELMPKEDVEKVEVFLYEGKAQIAQVYEEVMSANEVRSFADLEKYYDIFPDSNSQAWADAFENNPNHEVWDLLVDSPKARQIVKDYTEIGYNAKFLPKIELFDEINFADYIVFDSKVAIVELDPKALNATVINSKSMALSLKALHQVCWSLI
jgi:predicted transcriptional regulator